MILSLLYHFEHRTRAYQEFKSSVPNVINVKISQLYIPVLNRNMNMKVEKHKVKLSVTDHDSFISSHQFKKHGDLFEGGSKRALVVGSSGCGKTNCMISLLDDPNGLRFENLYLYSKSLYQPKYEYLRTLFRPMKEIGYFEYDDGDEVISPNEVAPNSVIIFDDVATCNQNIIRYFFCFGRHKNTDVFYLCQTHSSIPKRLIRDNANLIIIFKQDVTNLKHIYDNHVNVDMSFQQFIDMCSFCWKTSHGFVVIDKDAGLRKGTSSDS